MPHKLLGVPRLGMIEGFQRALALRGITADPAQESAALRLQEFYDALVAFKAARRTRLRKLLVHPDLPRGIWFWGGVGRGKSFLMDCFFDAVPYQRKRRVHFHAFMREIHTRLTAQKNQTDPLTQVIAQVAQKTRLMCFDEFHISDIADAMILGRLMQGLFDAGVLFCITSNYPPDGLYANGLHREKLLPAIALLNTRLDVVEIDAGIDYRLRTLEDAGTYHSPHSAAVDAHLHTLFAAIAHGQGRHDALTLLGRSVPVVQRAPGIIWFDFATLCGGLRAQNDYLELAQAFHTLILSDVPKLTATMHNEARRLTWLVDILYDHRVKLIISAACAPQALYVQGSYAQEFARTASRLVEMRTHDYLASAHRRSESVSSLTGNPQQD